MRKRTSVIFPAMLILLILLGTQPAAARGDFLLGADAWAYEQCGQFWPSNATFKATGDYRAEMKFSFSEDELWNLRCLNGDEDMTVKVAFHILGVNSDDGWGDYTSSSNIPNYWDGPNGSDGIGVTMVYINFSTADIEPNERYTAPIELNYPELNGEVPPQVSFELIAVTDWGEEIPVYLSRGCTGLDFLLFESSRVWRC